MGWTYMAACGLNSKKSEKNEKEKNNISRQSNLNIMLEFAAKMFQVTDKINKDQQRVKVILRIGNFFKINIS